MPVWHEKTRELRASGELVVIGITEEQHAERCRLFAQWHDIDWPILWDPFNLLDCSAVPLAIAIDEHGIVRGERFDPNGIEAPGGLREAFLDRTFEPSAAPAPTVSAISPSALDPETHASAHDRALSLFLFERLDAKGPASPRHDEAIEVLRRAANTSGADPRMAFRLGVAERLRFDSGAARPGDFQASLDHWSAALSANPSQYIWRRRIQQWGPRLDKPYSFYDWVDTAREAIVARGDVPVALDVSLSSSEVAAKPGGEASGAGATEAEPDPEAAVPRDDAALVTIESSVARHTSAIEGRWKKDLVPARVHMAFGLAEGASWSGDAGRQTVWLELPEGWTAASRRIEFDPPEDASSTARVDFEIAFPATSEDPSRSLSGYALYWVCAPDGTCTYRRQAFEVALP